MIRVFVLVAVQLPALMVLMLVRPSSHREP
jgi:hypothetical protein